MLFRYAADYVITCFLRYHIFRHIDVSRRLMITSSFAATADAYYCCRQLIFRHAAAISPTHCRHATSHADADADVAIAAYATDATLRRYADYAAFFHCRHFVSLRFRHFAAAFADFHFLLRLFCLLFTLSLLRLLTICARVRCLFFFDTDAARA